MSFRDEMLSTIKTPQEAEHNKNNSIINECKQEAARVFENIKYLLKEAAKKGRYEIDNDYNRIIKIKPCVIDWPSSEKFYGGDINCELLYSTINNTYSVKCKHDIWWRSTRTIYTFNVFIEDSFKYQAFMNELNSLAKVEGILLSLKMKWDGYLGQEDEYQDFPGMLTGYASGGGDEYHLPDEDIHLYLFVEMKL